MKIHHIALWTYRPVELRDFYVRWFGGVAGPRYANPANRYESYFVSFEHGAALEIMHCPDIPANTLDRTHSQHTGLIHIAFGLTDCAEVDQAAATMKAAGLPILDEPRRTGDGYYEFVTADPDGNRVEVTAKLGETAG